ncbi:MAG: glycosyltransferase family 2 protein [Planctomycetaceae bacterium]|nr:glycosyltransferase family 2 protein [Planctomycetaceae bacterium]
MTPRYLTALPVYNEQSHLAEVLATVRQYAQDILVVDDGSTDATPELLKRETGIQVVTHSPNRGYGAALQSAFDFAVKHKYDVLVTIDCDGQHEPRLIPELVARVFEEAARPADIVSGSRYLQIFEGDSRPPEERRRINQLVTELINDRLCLNLTDAFCGFKAYRVDALPRLNITEFGYAMPLQLWVQAVRSEFRIVEHPVPLIYLDESRSFGGSLDDANRRLAYYREVLDRELATGNECSPPAHCSTAPC